MKLFYIISTNSNLKAKKTVKYVTYNLPGMRKDDQDVHLHTTVCNNLLIQEALCQILDVRRISQVHLRKDGSQALVPGLQYPLPQVLQLNILLPANLLQLFLQLLRLIIPNSAELQQFFPLFFY